MPERAPKLFGNSSNEYLKVHRVGATEADVAEVSRRLGTSALRLVPTPTASS
jgi:hypothetical protein